MMDLVGALFMNLPLQLHEYLASAFFPVRFVQNASHLKTRLLVLVFILIKTLAIKTFRDLVVKCLNI